MILKMKIRFVFVYLQNPILACDISCVNCFGPSNLECTECLEESISNRIKVNDSCLCKDGYADYA